jgi:hypothetical protein
MVDSDEIPMAETLDPEEDFFVRSPFASTPPGASDVEWEVDRAPADPRLEARRARLRRVVAAVIGVAGLATLVLAISLVVKEGRAARAHTLLEDDLRVASLELAMPGPHERTPTQEPRVAPVEEPPAALPAAPPAPTRAEPARAPQRTPARVKPKRAWAWKKAPR